MFAGEVRYAKGIFYGVVVDDKNYGKNNGQCVISLIVNICSVPFCSMLLHEGPSILLLMMYRMICEKSGARVHLVRGWALLKEPRCDVT